jgi:HD superfamily phosphohydrolase
MYSLFLFSRYFLYQHIFFDNHVLHSNNETRDVFNELYDTLSLPFLFVQLTRDTRNLQVIKKMADENNLLNRMSEDSIKKAMELFKKNLTGLGVSPVIAETATKKEGIYSVDIKSQTISSERRNEKNEEKSDREEEGKIAISFKPVDSKHH